MPLRIQVNSPVTVKFPTGNFTEKPHDANGERSIQYFYSVEVQGKKDFLYAEKELHDLLQAAGMKQGALFTITKRQEGQQVSWKVEPAGASPASAAQANGKGPETGAPAATGPEALAGGLFGLAARCLRESFKAWQWLGMNFTSDNVQVTARMVFNACLDRGIVLPPIPYPDKEQMEALARIGDAIVPEQQARLEKKVAEGITWAEAQAIIDYYEKHGQGRKAA